MILVPANAISGMDYEHVIPVFSTVLGVKSVEIVKDVATQNIHDKIDFASKQTAYHTDETVAVTDHNDLLLTRFLPKGHLFKPLLADSRWAHFSATYRNFRSKNFDGRNIGSVSFGETIPFYRGNFGNTEIQWEAGIQGVVFSDFNLGAESADLINSDFIGALYNSLRYKQLSVFTCLYRQSSHLGDKFLLREIGRHGF